MSSFEDDQELALCLTVSTGISLDTLLEVLGKVDVLPAPQAFGDFDEVTYKIGRRGLLNVFEEGDLIVTLENRGFLGIARGTANKIADVTGEELGHYVAIYQSTDSARYHHYVEVQDGIILANFDPSLDEVPEVVDTFFGNGVSPMTGMINALEFRMETKVEPKWLNQPTDTYVIDYRTPRR